MKTTMSHKINDQLIDNQIDNEEEPIENLVPISEMLKITKSITEECDKIIEITKV